VYRCTIVIEKKRPASVVTGLVIGKKLTLNTGFGGEASSVARHHPAG
jgi:hypothetical protein